VAPVELLITHPQVADAAAWTRRTVKSQSRW
jgi:hypothetical protein